MCGWIWIYIYIYLYVPLCIIFNDEITSSHVPGTFQILLFYWNIIALQCCLSFHGSIEEWEGGPRGENSCTHLMHFTVPCVYNLKSSISIMIIIDSTVLLFVPVFSLRLDKCITFLYTKEYVQKLWLQKSRKMYLFTPLLQRLMAEICLTQFEVPKLVSKR